MDKYGGNQTQHGDLMDDEELHDGILSASRGVVTHDVHERREVHVATHLRGGSCDDHRGGPLAPSSKLSCRQRYKHWMGRKSTN